MHPISRPCFCGPRSPIYEWARSGPRRRPTIWGTWPPNTSPPIGINHLVRPAPVAVIAAVVVVFLAVGGYLIFGRGSGGGGQAVSVDVTVTGTTMDPSTVTVHQGDRVTIKVTADKKEEIHIHGYDIIFCVEK